MKLRSHLILLTTVTLLPLLVFTAVLVGMLQRSLSAPHEQGLRSTAGAISSAINEHLSSSVRSLEVLAAWQDFSTVMRPHSLAQLDEVAKKNGWRAVFLASDTGEHLLNTGLPPGSPLPNLAHRPYVQQVLRTGQPAITGYLVSPTLGVPHVVVAVPVKVEGRIRYVLAASLNLDALNQLLGDQKLPGGWLASVLDQDLRVLARSRRPEEFTGNLASPLLIKRLQAPLGDALYSAVNQEGIPTFGAFQRSALSGWTVAVSLPRQALTAPVRRTIWAVVAAALTVLLIGAALAAAVGRRLATPMGKLAQAAAQVGTGQVRGEVEGSAPTELQQVARALSLADARLVEERRTLDTLNAVGAALSGELELQPLIQKLTDEATALTGAEFGAYFHARQVEGGEFKLYTLSGAPESAFARFPPPRATAVFGPTFRGEGPVRSDNIRKDPRYGRNPPYHGMPEGHLPVCSYLAVPVSSRTGEVMGGLFFGHSREGVFNARHESMVVAVAAQAAVAIDNAHLYRKAQEAIALRDDFLSVAAHELKTPLTPLRLQLDGLAARHRAAPDAPLPPQTVERMSRQVARLSSLVEELLDVSRLASGRLELVPEPTELVALVRDVAASFEQQRLRTGSTLVLHADGQVEGNFDRGRVEQIVSNLITNALKYGEGKPIELSVSGDGTHAFVSVKDHGIGISAEDQARIFRRFERAVSSRHYGGLGLGLWIVRRVLDTMGGTVTVDSALGEGSTFRVTIPRAPPAALGPESTPAA